MKQGDFVLLFISQDGHYYCPNCSSIHDIKVTSTPHIIFKCGLVVDSNHGYVIFPCRDEKKKEEIIAVADMDKSELKKHVTQLLESK